jgi:dUTP pyrophosphatase
MTVELKIHRLPGTEDIPLPRYMSEGASGMDLFSANTEPIMLSPGDIVMVPTGIRIELPLGYEAQIRPRSGLAAKHGITVVNAPGTIDSDYRGEVKVILGNVSRQPVEITRGMRIAQMVIAQVVRANIVEADALNDTARGAGGFGHTGAK